MVKTDNQVRGRSPGFFSTTTEGPTARYGCRPQGATLIIGVMGEAV